MKPFPPLPPKPETPPPSGSWLSILLALGGGSIVLAALSVVTLFYLFPVFAIAALVFLIVALQYVVWGRWLRGYLERARDEDD